MLPNFYIFSNELHFLLLKLMKKHFLNFCNLTEKLNLQKVVFFFLFFPVYNLTYLLFLNFIYDAVCCVAKNFSLLYQANFPMFNKVLA